MWVGGFGIPFLVGLSLGIGGRHVHPRDWPGQEFHLPRWAVVMSQGGDTQLCWFQLG